MWGGGAREESSNAQQASRVAGPQLDAAFTAFAASSTNLRATALCWVLVQSAPCIAPTKPRGAKCREKQIPGAAMCRSTP